ncbi:sensor histidine kinase [Marinicrinis sediminis]|uniref:Sensor histidine kinase n=1 Tax=Marinicrinis sediminis TaxID=1652465 RepID=A0ABW5R9S5_9BACL
MRSRFLYFIGLIIILLLLVNNLVYYYSTKRTLEDQLTERMETVAKHIRMSITHSQLGTDYVEKLLAEQLRTASLVYKYALPADLEEVTNEQLKKLRDEIGLEAVTLFKQTDDDIVGYRSTEANEIGLSTNFWGFWYEAFRQLYREEPVTVGRGETLPHFWAGPFEVANSDPEKVFKWGYFYDGTTNYMIDPYINMKKLDVFDQMTGPTAVIESMLRENTFIKEITVFNHGKFGNDKLKKAKNQHDEEWVHHRDRPILYGSYLFKNEQADVTYVNRSMKQQRMISEVATLNDQKVWQSYIPVKDDTTSYVIRIVGDYQTIQNNLNKQFSMMGISILIALLITMIVIWIIMRFMKATREVAVQSAQIAYIEQLNEMFTTIRGQRHDFLNHVQTIHSLVSMNKTEALKQYTAELIGEIREVNDLIRVGQPAIAAIVQSKLTVAVTKKIHLRHQLTDVDKLKFGVKSVDIVKIIGNLVDNAFDAVLMLPVDERIVDLKVKTVERQLMIQVKNPGRSLSSEEVDRMFLAGYSTKTSDSHDGIGLAVTKERVLHYRGSIDVWSQNGTIIFTVLIPLDQ